MKKILFLVFCLTIQFSYAGGDSGKGKISHMYQRSGDGLLAVYKLGGAWNNPDGCQDSSFIVIKKDNLSRSEFYSSLLASKMADKEIQAYLVDFVDWNGVTHPVIYGLYTL